MSWLGLVVVCMGTVMAHADDDESDSVEKATACDTHGAVHMLHIACRHRVCSVKETPNAGETVQIAIVGDDPDEPHPSVLIGAGSWLDVRDGEIVCRWPMSDHVPAFATRRSPRTKAGEFDLLEKLGRVVKETIIGTETRSLAPTTQAIGIELRPIATDDDSYRDVVALAQGDRVVCTGIVIGPRHVLTAAHCGAATQVRLASGESRAIVERRPDPAGADVMILVTGESLGVTPRERAASASDEPGGGRVRLVGYGASDPTGTRSTGKGNWINALAVGWRCDGRRATRLGCVPGREVVIASTDADTCSGDSGGPVLDFHGAAWRLIAITSRALLSARSSCGGGGIYTHVGALAPWIDSEVNR